MTDPTQAGKSREPIWKCSECKYSMDECTCMTEEGASPREHDLTICLNCGHLYVRHSDRWIEPTVDEYFSFPREVRDDIERVRKARAKVVTENLAREDA